ncbi:MAG: adenylosuccinate lyase [Candidatus Hodarchaeota archaeon]
MTTLHYSRYRTAIADIFEEEKQLELQLQVERALARANAIYKKIPQAAAEEIERYVHSEHITLKRVKEIEKETHHDVVSVVQAATEVCPNYGEYVHVGATSSDIKDTVLGLQLKKAKKHLLDHIDKVIQILLEYSEKYKNLVSIGRTHGQHAIPISYGFKFANYLSEISIARNNFQRSKVEYGKMSGAVGTYAFFDTPDIETEVMHILGLETLPITTQVIPRIIHFHFIATLLEVVGVLDRLAREIRNLQRSEIGEVTEPFGSKQVGSSTMPQKQNPWRSERISGISRYLRQLLAAAHENISLEHERDLTNSSTEKLLIPQIVILSDFVLLEMDFILSGLKINEERVKTNLNFLNGRQCAENLLKHLTASLGRQKAHSLCQRLTIERDFKKAVKTNDKIRQVLSKDEIDNILDPQNYIGLAPQIVDRVIRKVKEQSSIGLTDSKEKGG